MTLTADRRSAAAARPARPVASSSESSAAPAPVRGPLIATLARADVYRVAFSAPDDDAVVGYVQVVGRLYVTLLGPVYNTSVEIAQCHDLDAAVACLDRAQG